MKDSGARRKLIRVGKDEQLLESPILLPTTLIRYVPIKVVPITLIKRKFQLAHCYCARRKVHTSTL